MQAPPEPVLTEQKLKHLGSVFADCIKEVFKGSLPDAMFTVYIQSPKSDERGNESSAFMYQVSDDSIDEETLQKQVDHQHGPIIRCFLDKLALEDSDNKSLGPNQVIYFDQILSFGESQISKIDEEPVEYPFIDESKWIEIVEFAQRDKWYSKIEITGGQVVLTIIQLTGPEIWRLLKPHLIEGIKSGNQHLTELLEKINNLPVEEIADILEEIKKILDSFFL